MRKRVPCKECNSGCSVAFSSLTRVWCAAREAACACTTALRALYFPDGFGSYVDYCVRLLFCAYYLPLLFIVVALTHSALERIVWVLLVPIAEDMARSPYNCAHTWTLLLGLWNIVARTTPFAVLGISIATVAHKAMNCIAEAAVDAYVTHHHVDYPLSNIRLQFLTRTRSRSFVLLVVALLTAMSVICVSYTDLLLGWSRYKADVAVAGWTVIAVQAGYVCLTAVRGAPATLRGKLARTLSRRLPREHVDGNNNNSNNNSSISTVLDASISTTTTAGSSSSSGSTGSGGGGSSTNNNSIINNNNSTNNNAAASSSSMYTSPQTRLNASASASATTVASAAAAASVVAAAAAARTLSFGSLHSFMLALDDEDREALVHYFHAEWWKHNTRRMRHIGFVCVLVFTLTRVVQHGLVYGSGVGALLLFHLTLPHLLGYTVLAISFAVIRTRRSFHWLLRHHHDVLAPVVVLVLPYTLALLRAMVHFARARAWSSVLLLLLVQVLLCARAIDLVREYDVSPHGSVQWRNAHTRRVLAPYLAMLLENSYELEHRWADVVSLDVNIDLRRMVMVSASGAHVALTRTTAGRGDVDDSGGKAKSRSNNNSDGGDSNVSRRTEVVAARRGSTLQRQRRFLSSRHFYLYTLPRLLSLQSPANLSGVPFRRARVLLRLVSVTLLLMFAAVVAGVMLQAAFPQLRPLPVRVRASANNSYLVLDHILVHMHLLSRHAPRYAMTNTDQHTAMASAAANTAAVTARATAQSLTGAAVGVPTAAHIAFKWGNVTSLQHEDYYPRLCTRAYYNVSVWELSLLALAPYLFSVDEMEIMLRFMNTHLHTDWVLRTRHGDACLADAHDANRRPTHWGGFYDVYSAQRDVAVLAVRGTDLSSFADYLLDINVYFDVFLYHLAKTLVPGAALMPKDLIVDLIRAASLPTRGADDDFLTWATLVQRARAHWRDGNATHDMDGEGDAPPPRALPRCHANNYGRDFFADLYNHLAYIATHERECGNSSDSCRCEGGGGDDNNNRCHTTNAHNATRPAHVVLTGHSLGGTVAAIVAAKMGLDAVVFSAPGVMLARMRFNVSTRALHRHVLTVLTSNDIVPSFGEHGGEVQHIDCLAQARELCHALEFVIGSLWRSCGSVRVRYPDIVDVV